MNYIKTLLVFSFCLVQLHLAAQVKTIIPGISSATDTSAGVFTIERYASRPVYDTLKFDLSSLPADAVIQKAVLRLVLDSGSGGRLRVTGTTCEDRKDKNAINNTEQEIFGNGTEVELSTRQAGLFAKMITDSMKSKQITFIITPAENNAIFRFYGSTPRTVPHNWEYCNVPRLVIYYSTEIKPAAWAGYKADARHTSCSPGEFGPENSVPVALRVRKLVTGGTIKNLTLDKGLLYFIKQANGSKFLYSTDIYTGNTKEITTFSSSPEWMPSMAGNGYYYYTVTNGLQPVNLLTNRLESDINDASIMAPPATGNDGSLYLCQEQYIKVYSPPPARKLVWRYPFSDGSNLIVSSPTLSADDSFMYVSMRKKGNNNTGTLMQINVLNKRETSIPIDFDPVGQELQLAPPVTDNNNNVFQLNGFLAGSKLFMYNRSRGLQTLITTTGQNITAPVCSGNYMYTVLNDALLVRYEGSKRDGSVKVTNGVYFMNTDKDGNVYVLDKNNVFSIYKFNPDSALCAQIKLDSAVGAAVQYNGMLVSPDGTVYLNSENAIYSIIPDKFSADNLDVSGAKQVDGYTYRANTIHFTPKAVIKKNNTFISTTTAKIMDKTTFYDSSTTTLQARNGIILQDNVHVQKGATFSCKTGR